MQKPISLQNFLRMSPQVPEFSSKNQHYLIAGANPLYYLDEGGQEQQASPMAASIDWVQVTATIVGNIVHMIPGVTEDFIAFAVTDASHVYGIVSMTSVTDLGYPSGLGANNGCYLAIGGNTLYLTTAGDTAVHTMPLTTPGTWGTFTGSITADVGVHLMEPFTNFLPISDSSGGAFTQPNLVRLIDPTGPSILATPQLNLGLGFGVMCMRNYNDQYLAVAFGKLSPGSVTVGYSQNYIALWDGTAEGYNFSVKVPGKFLDMKVVDAVLYVAVLVDNNKTSTYQLVNTSLRKVSTTQISSILNGIINSSVPSVLFDFRNFLGVHLNHISFNGGTLTDPILIQGSDEAGALEFIHSSGRHFDQISPAYDGSLLANEYVNGGNSTLWTLPTSGAYQEISYLSQWIPVENLAGIDIYYDTPPQQGNDAINVTIYGKGEDILVAQPISNPPSTTLMSITPSTYLNLVRTRLDLQGFTGSQVKVQISTVIDSDSTWRPIIRAISLI